MGKLLAQAQLRYTVKGDVFYVGTAQGLLSAMTAPASPPGMEDVESQPLTLGAAVATATAYPAPELGAYVGGPYSGVNNFGPFAYDRPWLPFEDILDWKTFAVLCHRSEIAGLYDRLKSIPAERVLRMRQMVKEVQPFFTMSHTCKYIYDRVKNYKW